MNEERQEIFDESFLKQVRLNIEEIDTNLSKKKARATNWARRMYEQIKFYIIDALNAKKYKVINDEAMITVWCEFPQTYLKNFTVKSIRDTVSFKMASEYLEECDYMIMQLRKYLSPEKIKSKIRVFEKKTGKDFKLANDYHYISNSKTDYVLGIQCSCMIPYRIIESLEQYILAINLISSDNNLVKVQWNNIPTAKIYEIYRWEAEGDKIILGTTDKNSTLYTDRSAQYETKYFYQVVCICENGEIVESSVEDIINFDKSFSVPMASGKTLNIDNMDGHEFEVFCAKLLTANGYEEVEVTKGSGDQGIDVIAYRDFVKFGIQCKCYSADIGNKAIQEAYAGKNFYDCHVGIVMTNRYFTKAAQELAQKNGIVLWNRSILMRMIEKSNLK